MSITVSEKKIKNKIMSGDRASVVLNIKYPFFESEKHSVLCKKMNKFYSDVAEKFSHNTSSRILRKIKLKGSSPRLPVSLSMRYTVALCNDKIVSIVLDLSLSDGAVTKTRRFSQMWSTQKKDIVFLRELLRTDRRSRKKIFSYVSSAARDNGKNPAFGYYDGFGKKLIKSFDISNCFAAPNGLCFFINAGILSPEKYGASSFVLPFDELSDVLKGDFLPINDKKEAQNADIVNNV